MWSSRDTMGTSPGFLGVYGSCGGNTGERESGRAANVGKVARILTDISSTREWGSYLHMVVSGHPGHTSPGFIGGYRSCGSSIGERRRGRAAHVGKI